MAPTPSQGVLSSRFEVVYTLVRLQYVRHNEDPDALLTIDRVSRTLRGRRAGDAGSYERQFPSAVLGDEDLVTLAVEFFRCIPDKTVPGQTSSAG